jgi:hypothetical protein
MKTVAAGGDLVNSGHHGRREVPSVRAKGSHIELSHFCTVVFSGRQRTHPTIRKKKA